MPVSNRQNKKPPRAILLTSLVVLYRRQILRITRSSFIDLEIPFSKKPHSRLFVEIITVQGLEFKYRKLNDNSVKALKDGINKTYGGVQEQS